DQEAEMSEQQLDILTVYQMVANVPVARNQEDSDVLAGKAIFQQVGCSDCHVISFTTKNDKYAELDGQIIHPFTDLLLHDMGQGLADKRSEFSASGSEWRTTPLWGLGFVGTIGKVKQHYLHDGRARTIEEAILWHGGEAKSSQEKFKNLEKTDRINLIQFLKSL
ncbi:MAG: thiol oxidoreductase, partial [Bdellovibrionales bacterium]|nr:thiol oxidoreductase [Bdellovibrionales bacterium]